jgi:hypothetical protein
MWRALTAVLLLGGHAAAARIVITCYDGGSFAAVRWSPGGAQEHIGACDLDAGMDGTCAYRVRLGKPRSVAAQTFDGSLRVRHRRHLQFGRTRAVVKCLPGPQPSPADPGNVPIPPAATTFTCEDAVLVDSGTSFTDLTPACDTDRTCDSVCTWVRQENIAMG